MSIAMMDSFKEYIEMFNKAVKDENSTDAIRIGKKLIQIADDQCKKPEINPAIKKTYSENSQRAREYLADIGANTFKAKVKTEVSTSNEIKWFSDEVPSLKLRDVKGLQDVKNEFMVNVLAPLSSKYSPIYKKFRGTQFGAQILLYGPPGTGKTFMVKCLAGSLQCHIAVVQTKDILASLVGDAEKNMSDVFEQAKKYDRCIIFFDEIDAIAASRDDDESRYTKGILTTMLTHMDGFTSGVKNGQHRIIIAATNRPWILDSALKRGGRFETQIYVPLPDYDARYQLVKLALGKDENVKDRVDVPCDDNVSIAWLAEKLDGMAGADINAVCRQIINRPLQREITSLLNDNKHKNEVIEREDCEIVIEKYINGITEEMLLRYEAYSFGLDLSDYLNILSKRST